MVSAQCFLFHDVKFSKAPFQFVDEEEEGL